MARRPNGPSRCGVNTDPSERSSRGRTGVDPPVVLVVEDERPLAELLAWLVEELGYTPVVASHGRQALELARERLPALVLTDLMMPYLDGAGLAAALRAAAAKDGRDAPPILLITAADSAAAERVGANAVLHKPFDLDQMARLLGRYLGSPAGYEDAR